MNELTKGHEDMDESSKHFKRGDAVFINGSTPSVFLQYAADDYAVVDDSPTDPYLSLVPVEQLTAATDADLTPELLETAMEERAMIETEAQS